MADTYWDHSSRREIKRLIDLGDAGAILDDLQNRETEWDDAREALDYLLRTARAEAERLRAELEADRSVGHGAKHWHDTYQQSMNAVDEFFTMLLALMPGAADEGMDAYDQIPRGIEKLTAEQARLAGELRKAAAYLIRRADLDADLSPSESRTLAYELRDASAPDGTEGDQ
ncbi:hypothetical protein AB0K34_13520 [Actinomadura sp. NPDC049382]|uniref:hypothetical protein n=1 Tax=Actinomadura sp. NPDC049382 TaxID=3158220 RepID=UPI00341A8C4D